MKVRVAIVIPARYGSTRLPGKPLADILGKPMIQHVVERALEVPHVHSVVVATDDERVYAAVSAFGGKAVMTSVSHESGTDRLGEVMQHVEADIYINLQGDEPLVRPGDITALINAMRSDSSVQVGTLCHEICADEALNPNSVKVVLDANGDALYFSRSPMPYPRDAGHAKYLKHVGVYGYRCEVLRSYSKLHVPMLELSEKLEQLRLLYSGVRIRVVQVEPTGPGVDTPECLERVRALLSGVAQPIPPSLKDIRLVITDVDGVLTDGSIYYDAAGESLKKFHVRDGLGIRMLEECGIRVAVVSGRDSATLRKRIEDLGISASRLGVKDKAAACESLMQHFGVRRGETACVGDDSIDLSAFAVCGFAFAVADAPDYVRAAATHTLVQRGGDGAFRELSDRILSAQDKADVMSTASGFARVMNRMAQ